MVLDPFPAVVVLAPAETSPLVSILTVVHLTLRTRESPPASALILTQHTRAYL